MSVIRDTQLVKLRQDNVTFFQAQVQSAKDRLDTPANAQGAHDLGRVPVVAERAPEIPGSAPRDSQSTSSAFSLASSGSTGGSSSINVAGMKSDSTAPSMRS